MDFITRFLRLSRRTRRHLVARLVLKGRLGITTDENGRGLIFNPAHLIEGEHHKGASTLDEAARLTEEGLLNSDLPQGLVRLIIEDNNEFRRYRDREGQAQQ